MQCITCQSPILYEPFYCILCEAPLCLFCSDKNEVSSLCDRCVKSQEMVVDIPRTKCSNKEGHYRNEGWFESYKCGCGEKMGLCKSHADICKYSGPDDARCAEFICEKVCKITGYCRQHREKCRGCKRWTSINFLKRCPVCQVARCTTCIPNEIANPKNLCRDHREPCHYACKNKQGKPTCRDKANALHFFCDSHARLFYTTQIPCDFKGCKENTCTSCWFEDDTVKVCHKHREKCLGCGLNYPVTKQGVIKLRSGRTQKLCIDCFRHVRYGIYCLLRLNVLPRDILDMIVERMLPVLEKPKVVKRLDFDLNTPF